VAAALDAGCLPRTLPSAERALAHLESDERFDALVLPQDSDPKPVRLAQAARRLRPGIPVLLLAESSVQATDLRAELCARGLDEARIVVQGAPLGELRRVLCEMLDARDDVRPGSAKILPGGDDEETDELLHAHHEALTARARKQHDALTAAIGALENALASAGTHRERTWADRAAKALERVREMIRAHAEGVEEPEGLFEEVNAVAPRLRGRVAGLCQEHTSLAARASALASRLTSEADPNVAALRREAAGLLSDLRGHRALEADLIYEAFWTEIGGGD
jgi:hypothetical protein